MFQKLLVFTIPRDPSQNKNETSPELDERLQDMGYFVYKTDDESVAVKWLDRSDALIICGAGTDLLEWSRRLLSKRTMPLIWWYHTDDPTDNDCQLDAEIDGMICSGMTDDELHWSLQLSSNRYLQRIQWKKEREQLLSKLEERKWIDKAKAILCEVKHISEPEAYEFLRKQAMNERKRMADVAASIVKVYQLLQENKGDERP